MTPAQMPESLMEKPERLVKNMAVGETAWITFIEIMVSKEDRSTYVNGDAKIRDQKTGTTVSIERIKDGFVLSVKPGDFEFSAYEKISSNGLPVVSIQLLTKT